MFIIFTNYFLNMNTKYSSNNHIASVATFSDLVNIDFQGAVNAICWHRNLEGNFEEIVSKLQLKENITEVSVEALSALQLSLDGQLAREIILDDLNLLHEFGASPSLNLIKKYERDDELAFISTDVYSFHVDRSTVSADTFLCTYHGVASEILSNEEAVQKIKIPEIRKKLLELYDGPDDEFDLFLAENFFDLHYQQKSDAKPISLGNGHLWRLAVAHPEQKVLPCIHRAPVENKDEYRLLLIC